MYEIYGGSYRLNPSPSKTPDKSRSSAQQAATVSEKAEPAIRRRGTQSGSGKYVPIDAQDVTRKTVLVRTASGAHAVVRVRGNLGTHVPLADEDMLTFG